MAASFRQATCGAVVGNPRAAVLSVILGPGVHGPHRSALVILSIPSRMGRSSSRSP